MTKLLEMTESVFWSRVATADANGCEMWTGKVDAYGYGAVRWRKRFGSRIGKAHRLAWELRHGPILDGLHVLHHCDNRRCLTDAHHFLGTQADNQRDMSAKGRNHNAQKTHCKQGHPYDAENTYINPYRGRMHRNCRKCTTAAQHRHLERVKESMK